MLQNEKQQQRKLTLFAITWPIFIEIMLHMIMGNADTLMLSQYSDDAVAAVGVSNQLLAVIIVMFGFIATGTSILVAQYLGANEGEKANRFAVVSLFANVIFGLLLSIILFCYSEFLLKMMNLPPELMDNGVTYLQIVGGFSFIQALIMTAGAIIRSHGFTKDAMYVTIGMNILNIIGNYIFIFGAFGFPELGVTGVAVVTAVSRGLGVIVLLVLLYKRVNGNLSFSFLRKFPKYEIKSLLKIGIPSAGEHLAYNTSQVVIVFFIASIGTEALTTKVYTQNIMMFILLFSVAIGQGTQILIGHQVGANKLDDAYKRCIRSLKIAVAVSTGMAIIFYLLSDIIFSIFTTNEEIIRVGSLLLLLTIILEPGRAFNLVVINSLRAAGDVRFPVYMGILSMWGIAVTVSYILGIYFGLGLIGIWIAFILDEWLRGLFMLWRWRGRKWQQMSFVRKVEQKDHA
ncbi:MATE family efflux transporter [Alkalihalobacterium chitinilyticum]|uniref:MATE family efflux transporter n=1 Tax=Alkalihalobacterium chitinilyticum TaxID=2980103 RepID=A0ABT5VJD8_9BACI|nr:MATE family efflux transporter [Alkalihalobacterium chitinilyticum]MDE5415565.1 MATE family efflux transporter [Alkalihalobacterium chitinilyticum]